MQFTVVSGELAAQDVDAVVVNLFSGVDKPDGATGAIDAAIGNTITALIEAGEITGRSGELTVIHTLGEAYSGNGAYSGFAPKRVVVAGLGKADKFDLDDVRTVSATTVRRLRNLGVKSAATVIHGAGAVGIEPGDAAEAMVEGAILGLYKFDKYKSKKQSGDDDAEDDKTLESLAIVEPDTAGVADVEAGVTRAIAFADAAALARDLVNEPPNVMTPTKLAEEAERVAGAADGLSITILERADAEKMGMGAFLGVAQGSREPLKIIRIDYGGDARHADNNLWLIGKGITFDSGGLSLKTSSGMETMKSDMAGGASVIAAIQAIAVIGPKINVTALCLATENMPGGGAQRVSDVVTAMSGMTIEVLNTDAEGRLTLADALAYARENGASRMVDVATLTGGIVTALGRGNSGAFSNDDDLVDALIAAGARRGEPIWRLPLDDVSKRQNRSKIADIKNTGGRPAHATTGAHFIGEFAGDTPWVHLDIAATAMTDSLSGWRTPGATGVPTRTLIQLVIDLAK
ncbi:MAG: leucyl aminopeptidase [Chloroflexi bacterium]|nr:leucyl aminopeptidase [Chloroflexota bacterium]